MSSHEYFEELAALATVSELSAEELAALKSHLRECESCRKAFADFSDITQGRLPLLQKESRSWWHKLTQVFKRNGYKQRFLRRATTQGFRFSSEIASARLLPRVWPTTLAVRYALPVFVLLIVALVALSFELRRARSASHVGMEEIQQRVAALMQEKHRLNEEVRNQTSLIASLESQFAKAQSAANTASWRAAGAERDRDDKAAESGRLKVSLETEFAKSAELAIRLQDYERRLAGVTQEMERLSTMRAADVVALAAQQKQLNEMTQEVRAQKELFEREHELLAANRDIRELMGARNLHIIDVFDTDQRGRSRRAFGRVFYTEAKSLIFYAFDLNGSKVQNAKHSFQAWGARDGQPASAKSLGIFYVDDAAQRRWVLKFEDPSVLKQIDSVFVTVEPFGGGEKPSGQKLLYAYLKNPANHP